MRWNNVSTTGTPPAGVMGYSTSTIGEEIYLFGGHCDSNICDHNDLYQLNVTHKVWRQISTTEGPNKKSDCGMISFSYQSSDFLLTLGGEGGKEPPSHPQSNAQYILCGGYYHTNEIHIMNVTTSPGKWISPTITGDIPFPLVYFTLNVLTTNKSKAVLFGGVTVPKKNKLLRSNDLYILSLTDNTVNFTRLKKSQSSKWPRSRSGHSSTIITSGTTEDHLLIIGGKDSNGLVPDSWILNMSTQQWNQIYLPQEACERYYHSLSTFTMNVNTQWIIITGGKGVCHKSSSKGVGVAMIIELEYYSGQWLVRGVWNTTQRKLLLEQMKIIKVPANKQETNESITNQKPTNKSSKKIEIHQEPQTEVMDEIASSQLQQKDVLIQQLTTVNQQLRVNYEELRMQLEVLTHAKDEIIQRKEAAIIEMQQEIVYLNRNPSWLIDREEVITTQEVIGKGGWGEVRIGFFRGTRVAVKMLHQVIASEYYTQLFSREMDIASRIRHPNLLQFIGATKVGNSLIVTELMPTSLRKQLEKSSMSKSQVTAIGINVASALNYLHCWQPYPILHRDVSSANVLLEPSGQDLWKAKLSDYGSANILDKIQTINPGNPVYSAPEANNPTLHSPAMDVYSFGILMTEMVTGQFPSNASYEKEIQIQSIQWPSAKTLITCCTHTVPTHRLSTKNLLDQMKRIL